MTAATAGRPNNPWSRSKVVAAPLALAAVILVAWEVSVRVLAVPSYVLPAPSQIAAEIYLDRKIIFFQLGVTLFEIMSGYFLSCVVGFCLSVLIVYSAAFRRGVLPLVVASQTIPVIAIAPLLVIWFGYNSIPRIIITALVAFFPLTISFVTRLQAIEPAFINFFRSLKANEFQIFAKLRFPAALPNIFGGLKVATTLAVIGATIRNGSAPARGWAISWRRIRRSSTRPAYLHRSSSWVRLAWLSLPSSD